MIQEFWFGSAWHWPIVHLPRIMLSYNRLRHLKHPWEIKVPWMMDSGAFSVISRYGDYPWSPDTYAHAIELWNPDIAWTMDYPCEPSVRMGKYDERVAQNLTLEQTRILNDEHDAGVMNVVQGWTLDSYLGNLDSIKERGMLTSRLGIGSICRRGQTKEILHIIRAIYQSVPRWVKLHAFGVKTDVLATEAKHFLYSADSMSWAWNWQQMKKKGRWTIAEKTPYLLRYIEKMQSTLEHDLLLPIDYVEKIIN